MGMDDPAVSPDVATLSGGTLGAFAAAYRAMPETTQEPGQEPDNQAPVRIRTSPCSHPARSGRGFCLYEMMRSGQHKEAFMSATTIDRVRELNDSFRSSFVGGAVMLTDAVDALEPDSKRRLLEKVRVDRRGKGTPLAG